MYIEHIIDEINAVSRNNVQKKNGIKNNKNPGFFIKVKLMTFKLFSKVKIV